MTLRDLYYKDRILLENHVYEELEGVVGPENISQSPENTGVYHFQSMSVALPRWQFPEAIPAAIILPSTTEEVQQIVKICDKYRVNFKATSTGWGAHNLAMKRGSLILDMRRMDKIIKIDEKNMIAVVESYVSGGRLQAAAMKVGLDCAIIGAGPNCSVLASCTAGVGYGDKGHHESMNNRNLLGVEWVTPTGEIMQIGSLECNNEWYSGDGPGPSLRGMIRGFMGNFGGLGVFTKCATKLFPWTGPKRLKIQGKNPQYEIAEIPDNFSMNMVYFPSWEKHADAYYKINESHIGYIVWRPASMMIFPLLMAETNEEYYKLMNELLDILEEYRHYLIVINMGYSKEGLNYQDKVLDKILEETEGKHLKGVLTYYSNLLFSALFNQGMNGRIFRPSGQFNFTFASPASWDMCLETEKVGTALRKPYIDNGSIHNDGVENFWGGDYEHGQFYHFECLQEFDPGDEKSYSQASKLFLESYGAIIKNKLGLPVIFGSELTKALGPMFCNFHEYLLKIKQAFDPNNVSDGSNYIDPEPPQIDMKIDLKL